MTLIFLFLDLIQVLKPIIQPCPIIKDGGQNTI